MGGVRVLDGQTYTCVEVRPYRRRDGDEVQLGVWEAECAECLAPFRVTAPMGDTKFSPSRRCRKHRRPGIAVAPGAFARAKQAARQRSALAAEAALQAAIEAQRVAEEHARRAQEREQLAQGKRLAEEARQAEEAEQLAEEQRRMTFWVERGRRLKAANLERRQARKAAAACPAEAFDVGDRVKHWRYGLGTVKSICPDWVSAALDEPQGRWRADHFTCFEPV